MKRRATKQKAKSQKRNTKPRKAKKIIVPAKSASSPRSPDYSFGPSKTKLIGPKINWEDWSSNLRAAKPPPGVVPAGTKMAMDELPSSFTGWVANSYYNLAFIEGWTFLGYPYLSQLAQIPEYRLISETVATEATRKWIEIQSQADEADKDIGGNGNSKSDKIKELDEELKRLKAREVFKIICEQDGFFGRAHLYIDTGDTDDRDELMKPLGNGGSFTEKKLKKGSLKALRPVEAVWCYPSRYDAADPLKSNWYKPNTWFVNGKEVNADRLITFVARPVPDLLKPAFSFGGLSLSQMAKPYVDNWLQTRQSVNDLIQAFSTMVLKTDLSAMMMTGGAELDRRIKMFNDVRNNRDVMAVSKNDEDFSNVAVPLGTLDKLQAQAQEHMATPAQIPLVKLFGIQPTGLNASSDGEIRVFYDREHAYQESFIRPGLDIIFKLAQINIWGKVDPDLIYIFKPLWELDEAALAGVKKTEAETDGILIDKGVLHPAESRQRIADDPDMPYATINVDDLPEPIGPEPGEIHERIDDKDDTDVPNDAEEEEAAA